MAEYQALMFFARCSLFGFVNKTHMRYTLIDHGWSHNWFLQICPNNIHSQYHRSLQNYIPILKQKHNVNSNMLSFQERINNILNIAVHLKLTSPLLNRLSF